MTPQHQEKQKNQTRNRLLCIAYAITAATAIATLDVHAKSPVSPWNDAVDVQHSPDTLPPPPVISEPLEPTESDSVKTRSLPVTAFIAVCVGAMLCLVAYENRRHKREQNLIARKKWLEMIMAVSDNKERVALESQPIPPKYTSSEPPKTVDNGNTEYSDDSIVAEARQLDKLIQMITPWSDRKSYEPSIEARQSTPADLTTSTQKPELAPPTSSTDTSAFTETHDQRLRRVVEIEAEKLAATPVGLDLTIIQARTLVWAALLADAHEDSATEAAHKGDIDQAMAWFADSMRIRDAISVISSVEIPVSDD